MRKATCDCIWFFKWVLFWAALFVLIGAIGHAQAKDLSAWVTKVMPQLEAGVAEYKAKQDTAAGYYKRYKFDGPTALLYTQITHLGRIVEYREPAIGWCAKPGQGIPLVEGSEWVSISDNDDIYCRIK